MPTTFYTHAGQTTATELQHRDHETKETDDYALLLARAAAATDSTGLSDGTDRPATTAEEATR